MLSDCSIIVVLPFIVISFNRNYQNPIIDHECIFCKQLSHSNKSYVRQKTLRISYSLNKEHKFMRLPKSAITMLSVICLPFLLNLYLALL